MNEQKEFKFQVAIESTGRHHKALVRFLQEQEIEVFVYNPQTAKHLAKAYLREKKTDKIDASILALLLIDGKFPTSQTDAENEFISIRSFSRRSSRYSEQTAKTKTRLKDELVQTSRGMLLVFPNQSVFNKAPMELLKKYPLPVDRLSAGIDEVTSLLKEVSNNKSGKTKGVVHLIANCAIAREVSVLIYNLLKYNRKYYTHVSPYYWSILLFHTSPN